MPTSKSWRPSYTKSITRRRFLHSAAAGTAAAAFLAACGGKDNKNNGGGSSKGLVQAGDALQAGKVWYAKDDWKLAEETNVVPGGVYPGSELQDVPATLDEMVDLNRVAPFIYEQQVYRSYTPFSYDVTMPNNPGLEPGTPEANVIQNNLAESWEISPDGLQYTFKLRPGVKFQNVDPVNGREMDMDDWKTSDERFMAEGFQRVALASARARVEYPDANTQVYVLNAPYAELLERMASPLLHYPIFPKELNENELAKTVAIGTNSRILDKFQPGLTHEYRRHDDYWRGKPNIERWQHPIIPEYSNRFAQFTAKNIHYFAPTAQDVLQMRKDLPDAVMYGLSPSQTAWRRMSFGNKNIPAPFNDRYEARARIALRRAIDWDAITNVLGNTQAFADAGIEIETYVATHIRHEPAFWLDPREGELGPASANYLFDLAEAKKLMSAVGYPDGAELDWYTPSAPTGCQPLPAEETLVIDQYNQSGVVKMNSHQFPVSDSATYYQTEEFSGMLSPLCAGGPPDFYIHRTYVTGESTAAFIGDPKMDDIAQRQRVEFDPQKRVEILKEFQRYAAELMWVIPADGNVGSFAYMWPWLHNFNRMSYQQWLDKDMPRRDG
jgi:peptide/nickel transport system substrate-binding protein